MRKCIIHQDTAREEGDRPYRLVDLNSLIEILSNVLNINVGKF